MQEEVDNKRRAITKQLDAPERCSALIRADDERNAAIHITWNFNSKDPARFALINYEA